MEDLIIRKLEPKDAEISWKWRNDPEIWKYTDRSHNNFITKEIEQAWIEQGFAQANNKRFAICVGKDQKYIGNVHLNIDDNDEASYHIFIGDKEYWGRGIASKATSWLIEYTHQELHLKKLIAKVHKDNQASLGFLTKSGFRKIEKTLGNFVWLELPLNNRTITK